MSRGSPGTRADPVHLSAIGVPLAVTFDDAPEGTREAFVQAWARSLSPDATPLVTVPAPAAPDVRTALHLLSGSVTLAAIEAAADRTWMVHAAGLADPLTGAGVALVAPSGTGKSTAARILGRRLGYLSDETVGLRPDGLVLAHPKPLSIVVADGADGADAVKDQVSPDDAGLEVAPPRATLRAVVLLARDGAATPWLEPVRTAAALPELAEQTSYLTRLPRPLSFVASILAGTSGVQRLHYREIADAHELVAGLLR